jgi:hypothetical protein
MAQDLKVGKFKVILEDLVETENGLSWQPFEIEVEADEDAIIDDNATEKELTKVGGILAYYGDLAAKARSQYTRKQEDLDAIFATLDGTIRGELLAAGEKPTETRLKKAVAANPQYRAAVDIVGVYRSYCYRLENLFKALLAKANALNTLAYSQRQEKKMY